MLTGKRICSAGLAALLLLGCAACGGKGQTMAAAVESTPTAAVTGAASGAELSDGSWTTEGSFLDDLDNHLLLYPADTEEGAEEGGWSTTLFMGENMYTGTTYQQDGTLTGVIAAYQEDTTPGEELEVTLSREGDLVLLSTGDGGEYRFRPDETDYSAQYGDMLPFYQYSQIYAGEAFDPIAAAACDYLAFEKEKEYDPNHAMIPLVEVVALDESNPKDVLLYAECWLWEFEKDGDTLVAVSGGHCPGLLHLERFGEGEGASYTALRMDEALTDDEAETLFGAHLEQYQTLASNDKDRETKLAQVLADYVTANHIDATRFRAAGEEAKELPLSR